MAGIIIPAHHEKPFRTEVVDIINVRTVSLEWYWDVRNLSTVSGFVNYRIELTHDIGGGRDIPWLVYEPGTGLQYKGPQQGPFGPITELEAQGFYALRDSVSILPSRNITVRENSIKDARGSLTIPGGRANNDAKAFWERMLRQFRRGLKFHLSVKLYAHDGRGLTSSWSSYVKDFNWNEKGAILLGEHRWQDIFEVDD